MCAQKTTKLNIRLRPAVKSSLSQLANLHNMSMSQIAEDAIIEKIKAVNYYWRPKSGGQRYSDPRTAKEKDLVLEYVKPYTRRRRWRKEF